MQAVAYLGKKVNTQPIYAVGTTIRRKVMATINRGAVARSIALTALILLGARAPVGAEDGLGRITVITSGGFAASFDLLGPLFEQATGIDVITEYGSSMGGGPESIPVRLARGETMDVLIFNRRAFADIAAGGHLRPGTDVDLARSSVGIAVRSGAPKPDVSTKEALVEALRAAESIGYSASVSGTYLSTVLFPQLGIWDEIEPKTQRVVGERVASVVARGEVEIGFQAVSEILSIDGVDFVGPIPAELQQISTFIAVIGTTAENPEGARRLIEFLTSRAAAAVVEPTGLAPVVLERSR
jgi:molybdate transport system substrate-binding protein